MKIALFFVGTLATSALWTSIASAGPAPGPKRPGPSAVEAARLKRYPAPSYLAHYLPDDRYKIAGGVWKYVSTDLDTYYHVPSSPNMLRQSASRVIGFANARDAEEAGYVADPSDGTASRAVPQASISSGSINGVTGEEANYLKRIADIAFQAAQRDHTATSKFDTVMQQSGDQQSVVSLLLSLKPFTAEFLASNRRALSEVEHLTPPTRLRTYHNLVRKAINSEIQFSVLFDKAVATGDVSQLGKASNWAMQGQAYLTRANAELSKLRR